MADRSTQEYAVSARPCLLTLSPQSSVSEDEGDGIGIDKYAACACSLVISKLYGMREPWYGAIPPYLFHHDDTVEPIS